MNPNRHESTNAQTAKKADTLPPSSSVRRIDPAAADRERGATAVTPLSVVEEGAEPSSTLAEDAAARRLVHALVERGVSTFFGVPGGPICPVFEALRLHPGAELVESRHESHAAFSAVSFYRATGRVPAVVLTAGPGITNAVSGIASAHLERTPLLVIAGDVAWASHGGLLAQDSGPEGIDVEQLLSTVTRAQVRVTRARSAVSQAMSALDIATDPIAPGPVLLVLPIDQAMASTPEVAVPELRVQHTRVASEDTVRTAARWLAEAERPLLVLGAGCRESAHWMRQLVDALDVPFVTTPRAKGIVGEDHPRSLRNGGMAASRWARTYTSQPIDVALVLGTDLDDTSMGPTRYVGPGGRVIHVDLNAAVFNRNVPTDLGVTADVGHFANDLYRLVTREGLRNGGGRALMKAVRTEPAHQVPDFHTAEGVRIPPHRAIADLQDAAGPGARFITDIGEHMLFALHYLKASGPDDFHIQLNLGSMGSGIAGAVGLGLADPNRRVVCICGDGGMHMSGMEILTSLSLRLPIVYAVFNDGRYNMVHHGMRQIFGAASPYSTPPVDFQRWAAAMGIPSLTIERGGQLHRTLLERLQAAGGPVLLDIRIDPEVRLGGGGRIEALQNMSMLARAASGGLHS